MICALCHSVSAVDPWTTCAGCAARLPVQPPVLSPAGVAICLELRNRKGGGRPDLRVVKEIPEPPLVGVPVPGIGLVGIDESKWKPANARPRRLRKTG